MRTTVREIVAAQPVMDIHTHLYSPEFGDLLLWGIDELLTYHYLIAETFRKAEIDYAKAQAELAEAIAQLRAIEKMRKKGRA